MWLFNEVKNCDKGYWEGEGKENGVVVAVEKLNCHLVHEKFNRYVLKWANQNLVKARNS